MRIVMRHEYVEGNDSHREGMQVFFASQNEGFSGKNSIRLPVNQHQTDTQEYLVNFANVPNWQGLVNSIRIDPVYNSGYKIRIESIEFTSILQN